MATRPHKQKLGGQDINLGAAHRPSVKPDPRNIPNPYFNKVFQLADSPEYDFIMGLIGDRSEEEELMALMEDPEVWEKLYIMLDRFDSIPLVPPTLPPAPQSLQLYSRTADDAYVADIGSGDTKKASASQSKISFYDINPQDPKVKRLDASCDTLPDVDVITSYNALTQLEDPNHVLNTDSIHIFPDVEYIKTVMGATCSDGKVTTVTKDKTFVDFDYDLPGDTISEGYKCANGYRPSSLHLRTTKKMLKTRTFNVPVKETAVELSGPATKKYDGIAVLLQFRGGRCVMSARTGLGVELEYDKGDAKYCPNCASHYNGDRCSQRRCVNRKDPRPNNRSYHPRDFEAILERVICGGSTYYILLRVLYYGRYIPFHGLNGLRAFCNKLDITIDGVPIRSPNSSELEHLPSDGFIFRSGGNDYRLKDNYTVDLVDVQKFLDTALNEGYAVKLLTPRHADAKVREYSLANNNGLMEMQEVRTRHDKIHETNYVGRMGEIMDAASRTSVAVPGSVSASHTSLDLSDYTE